MLVGRSQDKLVEAYTQLGKPNNAACLEYGEKGIRFNALAPGPIDKRMMESLGTQSQPDDPSNFRENVTANMPSGRYGTNEEMANLALFLGSDESSYCNGSIYLADGGFTAA